MLLVLAAAAPARLPAATGGGAPAMRLVEAAPEPAAFAPPPAEPEPDTAAVAVKSLANIAALADRQRDLAFKVLLKRHVRPVRFEPGRIDVALTSDAPKTLLNDLTARLRAWTGRNWLVSLSKEVGGTTLAEAEQSRRETAILDARADPTVAAILARFPGAKIIDVRLPDAPSHEEGQADADSPAEPPAEDDDDN